MNSLDQLLLPPEILETTSLTTALDSIKSQVDTELNQLIELKSAKGIDYTKLRDL